MRYLYGNGVEQSDSEAARWIAASAEQGIADAEAELGRLFEKGKGVERSDDKAAEFYRKAAEHGHKSAVLSLMAMVEEGRAYAPSDEELAEWYRKAIGNTCYEIWDKRLNSLLKM